MSTSDQPPLELRGPMGQVGDAGGGIVPLLAPAPVPNAMQGSPGVASSTVAPPITPPVAPTLASSEPSSFSLMLQQLAGQMFGEPFGGTSLHPMPAPGNASALSSPGSLSPPTGIAPTLVPTPPPATPPAA